jgi:hypothetical protein
MFWEYFIPAVVLFLILVITANLFMRYRYKKTLETIKLDLLNLIPKSNVEIFDRESTYQIAVENDIEKIIFKLIMSQDDYEFIITNINRWTVNNNPKQWTRKSKPIFIEGAEEFVNYSETGKQLRKIVLIYPTSKRIIRYLNESDTVVVDIVDNVGGISFIKYNELEKFLNLE